LATVQYIIFIVKGLITLNPFTKVGFNMYYSNLSVFSSIQSTASPTSITKAERTFFTSLLYFAITLSRASFTPYSSSKVSSG